MVKFCSRVASCGYSFFLLFLFWPKVTIWEPTINGNLASEIGLGITEADRATDNLVHILVHLCLVVTALNIRSSGMHHAFAIGRKRKICVTVLGKVTYFCIYVNDVAPSSPGPKRSVKSST